jgi:pimeloyl-ACP methyl ester carboxylesterase
VGAAIALALALRNPVAMAGVVAANGDGTPYGVGPGWRHALLINPVASAAVAGVVRHRAVIRSLISRQCGTGCPLDDESIDHWRAPFLEPGAIPALVDILRAPLVGLTYPEESAITVPAGVLYSAEDLSFDRRSAGETATRLHTQDVVCLPAVRHLALLGQPEQFAAALQRVLGQLPAPPQDPH